jgi:hypothetical protein
MVVLGMVVLGMVVLGMVVLGSVGVPTVPLKALDCLKYAFLHILCLNEYNFSILSSKFCSDSISKRKLIKIYVLIRSRNETLHFIQAALCTKEKSIQQHFIFQLC